MTTSKLLDNNRRSHAAKVLAKASKKNQEHDHDSATNVEQHQEGFSSDTSVDTTDVFSSLNEQYGVIREDILKLREDLAHGYDLLKDYVASNLSIKTLLRSK